MSQRDKRSSSNYNQNSEGEQGNRQEGKTKVIIYLIFAAFLLGSAIASGVTFILIKGGYLTSKNSTPSTTPILPPSATPIPTLSLSPPPSAVQPSPTPTETPSASLQPTEPTPPRDEPPREETSKNIELPGYFPNKGFTAPPSELSRFKKANLLLNEMVVSGNRYIDFDKEDILIRGQLYSPVVFHLRGNTNEQRVGFQLDGSQQGILLQFGLQDLESGDTNLTYLVRLSVDGELLWAGECQYGKNNQIISVPLGISGARSLVIEYSVTEKGGFPSYSYPRLYFTRGELLYE